MFGLSCGATIAKRPNASSLTSDSFVVVDDRALDALRARRAAARRWPGPNRRMSMPGLGYAAAPIGACAVPSRDAGPSPRPPLRDWPKKRARRNCSL